MTTFLLRIALLLLAAGASAQLVDDFECPDEFAGFYPHLIRSHCSPPDNNLLVQTSGSGGQAVSWSGAPGSRTMRRILDQEPAHRPRPRSPRACLRSPRQIALGHLVN